MGYKSKKNSNPHYYSDCLKNKLKRISTVPATVIEAPSGYGKTTAVQDYLKSRVSHDAKVYWFTAENEAPTAGFRRLCGEINKIDSNAVERLLRIDFPNAITIGEVCDALRSIDCTRKTYLVIDNFQLLSIHLHPALILALLEHGGESLHIVLITQMLSREVYMLIAGHGYYHISETDLRLTAEDIRKYFAIASVNIVPDTAKMIASHTEGWVIAVNLQLCSYQELGVYSDTTILERMEYLVWDTMTEEQQMFLLFLSPFETITIQQASSLIDADAIPEYALDALHNPFIHYNVVRRQYEIHGILSELLVSKRAERGTSFERDCLLRAGDLYRDFGLLHQAIDFYWQIRAYERILSQDFSSLMLVKIGKIEFKDIALDIAQNCPSDIKKQYRLPMLRIAWSLKMAGLDAEFDMLLIELHPIVASSDEPELLGDWMLLKSFQKHPFVTEMKSILMGAKVLFSEKSSRVIMPTHPFCFGNHSALAEYHLLPGEADREVEDLAEYITLYSKLTNGHGSGADILFRAELAYQRCQLAEAEVLAYKAIFIAESHQQSVVQLGATLVLAHIALHNADSIRWQQAVDSLERAAAFPGQDNVVTRALLDTVRGILLNELKDVKNIAPWLKEAEFWQLQLPLPIKQSALFVHLNYLLHNNEFPKLIGTAQALLPKNMSPYEDMLYSLTIAVGHIALGEYSRAMELVGFAAHRGLPDGMVLSYADYSFVMKGIDEIVKQEYPEYYEAYCDSKEKFILGWQTLHDAFLSEESSLDLTAREYEVARLAATGLKNNEIAKKLFVTENTIRYHLRQIFQKLNIDRRAKLSGIQKLL
ncbi:MAG: helix-turn-helix transcriptional regulator [Methanosarcinales archaeon]|nr:helix-turn-helix transcriptional regulator [Methanosarcinales archaeon]